MMAGRPGTVQPQGGVKEQLANIRKLIMEAQTLDDNGDELVCELLDTTTPSPPHLECLIIVEQLWLDGIMKKYFKIMT